MLANTYYYRQLPREINPGRAETFELDMLKPGVPGDCSDQIRLRIHTLKPCSENLQPKVTFNGTPLIPTPDTSRFFGNPFDSMISPLSHRRAWTVPRDSIVNGLNKITITAETEPFKIIYIDCAIPRDMKT